jgi:hypothetical protein
MKTSLAIEHLLASLKMSGTTQTEHSDKTITVEGVSLSGDLVESITVHVKKQVIRIVNYELRKLKGPNNAAIKLQNIKVATPRSLALNVKAMRRILKYKPDA